MQGLPPAAAGAVRARPSSTANRTPSAARRVALAAERAVIDAAANDCRGVAPAFSRRGGPEARGAQHGHDVRTTSAARHAGSRPGLRRKFLGGLVY
jgi:hypothetical protein